MSCLKYITETKIITSNTTADSFCNSVTFFNTGTTNVIIDGIKVTPGTSFSILGNRDEMNIKFYSVFFVAGGNPELTIVYKKYVK